MNPLTMRAESLALWLADYYLLASVLLFATLATSQFLKQPVQRLAIAKATVVALSLLAILCAIPGWSLIHLFTAEQLRTDRSQAAVLEPPFVADLPAIPVADTLDTDTVAFSPSAIQRRELQSTLQPTTNWRDLPWARIVIAAQVAGTMCVFAWLVLGAFVAHCLQRTAQPAPPDLIALMSEIAVLQNISLRLPDLRISDRIDVAVALGIFRPTVLLPTDWLKSHAPDQLRTVLAHELAHVANRDLRWLAASRALLTLLWSQPLLWLLRRQMRLDQESLADAAAAELTSRQSYAEQLVAWARQKPTRTAVHLSVAVGLWERPSQLRQRVAILLNEHFTVLLNCSCKWRFTTLVACLFSALALSLVTLQPSKTEAQSSKQAQVVKNPAANAKQIEIPIIVAKHVLLHEGTIIEWADVEKLIAAQPNPKLVHPAFYFTSGALPEREEEIRSKIWPLRQRVALHGHTWASISPRTSFYYDAIRTVDDLVPNEARRMNGTVETADGLPIDAAEVMLLSAVPESLPYKTLDVYLRNERVRQRNDEIVADTDNSGRFTAYPQPETPYYLMAIHREGFGLVRSDDFAKSPRIVIKPWAHIRGQVKEDSRFKQSASYRVKVPAESSWPEIVIHQFSEDIEAVPPDRQFEFAFVPPDLPGTLSRSVEGEQGTSFGLPTKEFKLAPGETLSFDIEPPNDDEAARIQMLKAADEQRQREAEAARAAEEARRVAPNEIAGRVVDVDGKPLSGVVVDVWTWHPGNETISDADGRFTLSGFEDYEALEVQFTKPGYGPVHFAAQRAGQADWTVTLANDTYLEGSVLDPDGKPVPRARIRAARGPFENPQVAIDEVWTSTSTDAEGRYRFYFEPDTYDIQVRVPGVGLARLENTVLAKGDQRQLDIELRQGPTFRAIVLDSETNEPVAGIRLWNWRQAGIEGVSGADGLLTIENMTPGEFEFQVTSVDESQHELAGQYARWWSPDALRDHERKLEKDNSGFQRNFDSLTFNVLGNTEPIKIFVEKAVTIRGRVVDPEGFPVPGATVAPALTGSGNSITGDTRYSVRTADDGTFQMRLPASGSSRYNLVAHDGGYQEWRQWANGVGEVLQTHPGQETTNIELQLTRAGVVRGIVVDADGMPVAKHRVRTQAVDKLENRYYDPETLTNEIGQFELKFVRPGDHFVQAGPFWIRTEQADDVASKRITIEAGEPIDGIELIHHSAEPKPPIDHFLPDVPIPRRVEE